MCRGAQTFLKQITGTNTASMHEAECRTAEEDETLRNHLISTHNVFGSHYPASPSTVALTLPASIYIYIEIFKQY